MTKHFPLKTKSILPFTLLLVLFFAACKKDESQPTPEPSLTTEGYFLKWHFVDIEADTLQGINELVSAFFPIASGGNLSVDSVLFNHHNLEWQSFDESYTYYDSLPSLACDWHVKGKNGIPDFDYSYATPMPAYDTYKSLPDSINRLKDLTISLLGMKNVVTGTITIRDFNGHVIEREFEGTDSQVTFTTAELYTLQAISDARMEVMFMNFTTPELGGKQFMFEKGVTYFKEVLTY